MTTDEGEGERRMHLIVDGKAKNIWLMTDKALLSGYIRALVEATGMTVFQEPIVSGYPWPGSTDTDALSAVCFLKESAVMVHCYPEQSFVFVDVFSCKEFDVGKIYGHIKRAFEMDDAKCVVLERGVDAETGQCVPATVKRNKGAL